MTVFPDLESLDSAFLDLLAPVTRWRFPPTGNPVRLNEFGFDHWVGRIGAVRLDDDGRAHQYIGTWDDAGQAVRGRVVPQASRLRWGVHINVGGGDPRRVRWTLGQLRSVLDGAALETSPGRATAPLREVFGEGFPIREDDDVSPPRWYTSVRYATSAH